LQPESIHSALNNLSRQIHNLLHQTYPIV
jgi:hypothetical protein